MTRQQIKELPAGPEMDAMVAKHIFGWEFLEVGYWQPEKDGVQPLPTGTSTPERQQELTEWMKDDKVDFPFSIGRYFIDVATNFWRYADDFNPSTSMEQAWQIVEKLREQGVQISLWDSGHKFTPTWDVRLIGPEHRAISISETVPLAICRAALLLVLHAG